MVEQEGYDVEDELILDEVKIIQDENKPVVVLHDLVDQDLDQRLE